MKSYYITFRSVTFAQRAEKLLAQMGIRCNVMRTPRWMEEQGCGYALKIWTKDVVAAAQALQENRLPQRRIYLQHTDGHLEEIQI